MRIVKPDALYVFPSHYECADPLSNPMFRYEDTIEITDAQLDEIVGTYIYGAVSGIGQVASGKIVIRAQPFSQYLRDLISLTGEGAK